MWVEKVKEQFDCPGLALGVICGKDEWKDCWGVRSVTSGDPINTSTLFGIASNSKAFAAATIAILVDQKKLSWDDKVQEILPSFRLHDYYASREMTIRDLLCHRSGLAYGAGDLLFWPTTNYTLEQLIEKIQYLKVSSFCYFFTKKPASSFRSQFAYTNVMYGVLGKIVQVISGITWTEFLQNNIFKPLGMESSNSSLKDLLAGDNNAVPHIRISSKYVEVDRESLDVVAPAGAINSNINDMMKWVKLQLNRGAISSTENLELFSKSSNNEMWKGHTILPTSSPSTFPSIRSNFCYYCLGWVSRDYKGFRILYHTGGLIGEVSKVCILPDLDLGIVLLMNHEVVEMLDTIVYQILDYVIEHRSISGLQDLEECSWIEEGLRYNQNRIQLGIAAEERENSKRILNTSPSLELSHYTGIYIDSWYGNVKVELDTEKGLTIQFTHTEKLFGKLVHWHHNTFLVQWFERKLQADAFITFLLNKDADVFKAEIVPASPLVDFSYDFKDLELIKKR